jgi:hypothetical protein
MCRLGAWCVSSKSTRNEPAGDDCAVALMLGEAMDYLTRKDYANNWLSETHEQFCGLEFSDWKTLLNDVGFEVDPASSTWRNDWIIQNRVAPVASITSPDGNALERPATHILIVARRPLNS